MGLALVLAVHALLALVTGLAGRRLGRSVLVLGALAPATAVAYLIVRTSSVIDGEVIEASVPWVPDLGLMLDLRLDAFGLLFWWLIAGIGLLVFLYGARYFDQRDDLGRFTAMLVLFAGAMLLLTSADNVLLLFVGWELTSVTSYLLIGFDDNRAPARAAALQALLVTGLGGLVLLAGLVLLGLEGGTYSLAALLSSPPTGGTVTTGLVLVLVGAMTKSAQAPFHFWLPGAMAAPTPVSAYLHSATMVKAGIYLVARVAPAFAPVADWWTPTLLTVGAVSMLVGGYRALKSTDLKELLAYGTVSQLGFIFLLVGAGDHELLHAGVAVLFAHALFKAALFLCAGVVDHQAHTRDLRRLDGIGRQLPVTAAALVVATASMAGVPPLLGFVAKEAALESSLHAALGRGVVVVAIVAGAVLTTAYGLRLIWGAFASKSDDVLVDDPVTAAEVERPPLTFELPAVVLVVASVAFGVWVAPVDALVEAASASLDEAAAGLHLALWHGFGAPLALSVTALAVGTFAFVRPRWVERTTRFTGRSPDTTDVYRRSLFGLNRLADRVTAFVQPGSLPVYLAMVLGTAVLLPGHLLVGSAAGSGPLTFAHSGLQVAVGALVIGAAIGTAVVRHRLSAVLLLGAVGYGVAVLFVIQGAPDLALTQLLVETLALAIFVLVLRRLPERFEQPSWRFGRGVRILVSVSVGVFVAAFALIAAGARRSDTSAAEYLARAQPEGGGSNVVNVILTDFRALDTVGEITVVVVAVIGVVSLVRAQLGGDEAEER